MKEILGLVQIPFLLVGLMYEWLIGNPLLKYFISKRFQAGRRADKLWHFLLIALIGYLSFALYLLTIYIFPDVKTFFEIDPQPTSNAVLTLIKIYDGFIKFVLGTILIYPIHFLSKLYYNKSPKFRLPNGNNVETPTPITVIDQSQNNTTVVNITVETPLAGTLELGPPADDGSLNTTFTIRSPGNMAKINLSTADSRSYPFSGSIDLTVPHSNDNSGNITGSDSSTDTDRQFYDLNVPDVPNLKLRGGPSAEDPDTWIFEVSSPPGTIPKEIPNDYNKNDNNIEL